MKQWEVIMFPFVEENLHPAVIISIDEICQNGDIATVNALICSTARATRPAKAIEEILDENDGLDWKTLVRCDRIFLLPKAKFKDRKGSVSLERRSLIGRKIVEAFRLPLQR
ncbi:MAG TPA: type II toxin-antitoxin system PemK/MazF family toxin [Verrucomicrobiae bacterium]|nr:type II toxin-antitoxin system PemK/MazF family toxin [Verrucomicrobiae bacterium]